MADFKTFVKKLHDAGYFDVKDNKIEWNHSTFAESEGWPAGLDCENFEITSIGKDYVHGYACGDWQEGTTFCVVLNEDNELELIPFDPKSNDSKVIVKHKQAEMVDIIKAENKALQEAIEANNLFVDIHEYLRELEGEDYGFGRGEKRHNEENYFKLYVRGKDGVQALIKANPVDGDVLFNVKCLTFVDDEMSKVVADNESALKDALAEIVNWLKAKLHLDSPVIEESVSLQESSSGDVKTLKSLFNEFNKEFFGGELPDVEIKITHKDTEHSKGVAGSFNFHKSIHTNNGENKHYKLADLKKESNLEGEEKRALNYIKGNAYIEMPKDIVDKGKYYYASVLLHEMVHEYIEFCTNSHETDCHGPDFKKKVDEINKKSKNEWRVPYEEVPPELVSDKPIEKRPEDIKESFWTAYYKNGLNSKSLRG